MEENISKTLFEANAALNALEFSNRQILLKGDGAPTTPAPFGATYIDQLASPPDLYRQIDAGVGSNWVLDGNGDGGPGINGAVFITDIQPQNAQDNVGSKVYSSDGNVLDSAISNTDQIRVFVLAAMGHTNYKPLVTVGGDQVALIQDEDQSIWHGAVDISLGGATTVSATHEDGAEHTVNITADIGPEIQTAVFTGGYPGSQTELKAGDSFQIQVNSDTDMTRIEIDDFGAGEPEIFDFAATTAESITISIADRGTTTQSLGLRLRAMNANGSFGGYFLTTSAGSTDGVHLVNLNNLFPSGLIDAVQYPNSQQAIKDNEQAAVDLLASDYDKLIYESPNSQLSIASPSVFAAFKPVARIAGDYNVSTPNIRVTLTRSANDAQTVVDEVVKIAHIDPVITVTEPATRLRSGGNHGTSVQNHEIALASNQELLTTPVISVPHGTLDGSMLDTGDKMTWQQNLRVHDDDQKGVFQFSLTQATNIAGKVVSVLTGDNNYELGGFVRRTIQAPPFNAGRELDLLVTVSDTSKVVVRDFAGALLTYKNDFTDQIKTYTITGPVGVLNVMGNYFYWTDSQAVNNNTTGLTTITVEEVV